MSGSFFLTLLNPATNYIFLFEILCVRLPSLCFTCVSRHHLDPRKVLEEVKSIASRACWKVLEEVKSVASRESWKVPGEGYKSVASRERWKLQERSLEGSIKSVLAGTASEEKSIASRA